MKTLVAFLTATFVGILLMILLLPLVNIIVHFGLTGGIIGATFALVAYIAWFVFPFCVGLVIFQASRPRRGRHISSVGTKAFHKKA